jgi:hypothetical protein
MCDRVRRRTFLADMGLGFAGLALGSIFHRDGLARDGARAERGPHFVPRAKSVIWLFMTGGVSHLETFDPKPALNKYAGMSIDDTPWSGVLKDARLNKNLRVVNARKKTWKTIYPLQVGVRRAASTGTLISDQWPHLERCLGDIALVRGMWTTDDNHGAQLQFHTGRHMLDGMFPSLGSWVQYGLGSLNENLPQFVVLGTPPLDRFGGNACHRANYLGTEHDGVPIAIDPVNPLPFGRPGGDVSREEQEAGVRLVGDLNRLATVEYPEDADLRARIKSYELAFRMQRSMPGVFRFEEEPAETRELYGLDAAPTQEFGRMCLSARRLVERGVRFVQVYAGGGMGRWDTHSDSRKKLAEGSAGADRPIAGLLADLKRRGLLDETLVCFMTEFGRTPGGQGDKATGREHHPYGFTVWMAGGGVKGGVVHGATDELGFHAVEGRHYVTDIHATVVHLLGLDSRLLEVPGRRRLDVDHGEPIAEILA